MVTNYTFFYIDFMRLYIPSNVKFSIHKNDNHCIIYIFRNLLELLSICIQMCSYLQNNIHKLLCAYNILCTHRADMLDNCTWNV